ncbi:MAG TPA: SPFH domain-containing protein, partial [Tepidisphaeraceae bacterium]
MQLAPGELARRTPDRVIYSHGPRTVSITLGPTITRDGHQLSLQCALTTHLVERDADLVLFNEQLLQDRSVVTLDSVRQHLAGPLATSLAEFAQQHDAATCLAQRATVSQLILKRANDIGFACGLEFLPPLEVQLRCPTLEAQQAAEQVARQQSSEAQHAV